MGETRKLPPGVRLNPDAVLTAKLQKALAEKNGYCPCRLKKTADNLCICREFREEIADPGFEGFCHCRLYYKEKQS